MIKEPRYSAKAERTNIRVVFVRVRYNGSTICVNDGRTEKSKWTGNILPLETWIPIHSIDNLTKEQALNLPARKKLTLTVPKQLAEIKGFKCESSAIPSA